MSTPVTNLLLYLYRKSSAGTLVLEAPDGRTATVLFRGGRPVAARFSDGSRLLMGGLAPMCGLTDGSYRFYEEDLIGDDEDAARGAVDPYALLMMALRDHPRDDLVDSVLARYEGTTFRIQPGREVGRLRLRPDEQTVVELLRAAPADPAALVAQAPLPNRRAARVVYALLVTHMITPYEETRAEAATYRSQVMPAVIEPPSPHQPSLRVDAAGSRGRSARSPLPPPGARPPAESPALRRPVGNVSFNNINAVAGPPLAAWQRLASLKPGAMPRVGPVSDSRLPPNASKAQRIEYAEKLLEQGKAAEARDQANRVLAEDAYNPSALALKAHAMISLVQDRSRGLPKEILQTVRLSLRSDPDQPRALLVKGLIYKEANEYRKAYACFKRATDEDPKNLEAQRELRLAKMRIE